MGATQPQSIENLVAQLSSLLSQLQASLPDAAVAPPVDPAQQALSEILSGVTVDQARDILKSFCFSAAVVNEHQECLVAIFRYLRHHCGLSGEDIRSLKERGSNRVFKACLSGNNGALLKCLHDDYGINKQDVVPIYNNNRYNVISVDVYKCLKDDYGMAKDDFSDLPEVLKCRVISGKADDVKVLQCLKELFGVNKADFATVSADVMRTCAIQNYVNMLKCLKEDFGFEKTDVQVQDNVVFRAAAEYNHVDVLKCLREVFGLGADDARVNNNHVLRYAARHGYGDVLKCLKDHYGLGEDDARVNDNEALREAARLGHVNVLKCLKEDYGLGLNDAQTNGIEALRKAARYGHVDVLRCLKNDYGLGTEDARACDNAALRDAALCGKVQVLKCLQEDYGLGTEDARACDNAAFHLASIYGHADVLRCLKTEYGFGTEDARACVKFRQVIQSGLVDVLKCLVEDYGFTKEDYERITPPLNPTTLHFKVKQLLREGMGIDIPEPLTFLTVVNKLKRKLGDAEAAKLDLFKTREDCFEEYEGAINSAWIWIRQAPNDVAYGLLMLKIAASLKAMSLPHEAFHPTFSVDGEGNFIVPSQLSFDFIRDVACERCVNDFCCTFQEPITRDVIMFFIDYGSVCMPPKLTHEQASQLRAYMAYLNQK